MDLFPCLYSCNAFIVDVMHALIIMNCQGSQNLGLHLGSRVDDVLEGKLVDQRHQVFTAHRSKDLSQICKTELRLTTSFFVFGLCASDWKDINMFLKQ